MAFCSLGLRSQRAIRGGGGRGWGGVGWLIVPPHFLSLNGGPAHCLHPDEVSLVDKGIGGVAQELVAAPRRIRRLKLPKGVLRFVFV